MFKRNPLIGMYYKIPASNTWGKIVKQLPYSNYYLCEEIAIGKVEKKVVGAIAKRVVCIQDMKTWVLTSDPRRLSEMITSDAS
jgi:hypothetical protein